MKKVSKQKVIEKLVRAALAKSGEAKANYLIDILGDEILKSVPADELMHAIVEIGAGGGTIDQRFEKWLRKAAKHRLKS